MDVKLTTLCGYGRPRQAWRLLQDISAVLEPLHREGLAHGGISTESIVVDPAGRFSLAGNGLQGRPESDIWSLGAAVFELLMGIPVFGGKGESSQTESTPVPRFSASYGEDLSLLVKRCLDYDPEARPDATTIHKAAVKGLEDCEKSASGRVPKAAAEGVRSDLNYWSEKMK